MTTEHKEEAIAVLKQILHLFHEKRYGEIRCVVSESQPGDATDVLLDCVQKTLDQNGYDAIDEYGAPCSFRPSYPGYTQMHFYNIPCNPFEPDPEAVPDSDQYIGFSLDYEMTSDSELVDMTLQLDFLYRRDGSLKSIFRTVDPQ